MKKYHNTFYERRSLQEFIYFVRQRNVTESKTRFLHILHFLILDPEEKIFYCNFFVNNCTKL
jgi:hypothetical protein